MSFNVYLMQMISSKKIFIFGLMGIILISSLSATSIAKPGDGVGGKMQDGSLLIDTPYLKVKMLDSKPDIFFWVANSTEQVRPAVYHVGFMSIAEVFGDDLVIDNKDDLNGKVYNLASDLINWDINIENGTDLMTITQTSSEFANGAQITFVYYVFFEDTTVTQEINGTEYTNNVQALTEVKFDIIVENWVFSEDAIGLALQTRIHENAYRHRVRSGEGVNVPEEGKQSQQGTVNRTQTNRTADPSQNGVEFYGDDDERQAYFAWTPQADVFDENGIYLETVNVTTTSASFGNDQGFGQGQRFGSDFTNLYLVYPNYGDNVKLVHDPVIGIDNIGSTNGINFSLVALTAIPIVAVTIMVMNRRRK